MKKFILTLSLILSATLLMAQTKEVCHKNEKTRKITRKGGLTVAPWFIVKNNDGSMSLSNTPNNKFGYGSKVVFHADGTMIESYSAPCGNDSNIHSTKGTWKKITQKDGKNILVSSIDINKKGNRFEITKTPEGFSFLPNSPRKVVHRTELKHMKASPKKMMISKKIK